MKWFVAGYWTGPGRTTRIVDECGREIASVCPPLVDEHYCAKDAADHIDLIAAAPELLTAAKEVLQIDDGLRTGRDAESAWKHLRYVVGKLSDKSRFGH